MGTPTLEDLSTDTFWNGMKDLAALPNTFIKISMLCYTDLDWDQNPTIIDAIHKIIDMFGVDRCFFASNFPPDLHEGWTADRLFDAFDKVTEKYSDEERRGLFSENAKKAYNVD